MTKEEALKLRGTPTDKDGNSLVTRESKSFDKEELAKLVDILCDSGSKKKGD